MTSRERTRFEFSSGNTGDAAPRPGDYTARLDRTGLRVLCEKACTNGELATIRESAQGTRRGLVMSNGWVLKNGVWVLNEWARKRLAHGDNPRARRGQIRSSRNVETGKKDSEANWFDAGNVQRFPAVAICPTCRHRNVLWPENLRVMTEDDWLRAYAELDDNA